MTGVATGSSDLPGHQRGQAETVAIAVHEADESSGPRRVGVPSLTSLATPEGATALALAAGVDPDRVGQAGQALSRTLGSMSVGDITTTNQTNLAAAIQRDNPGVSAADAMAFAAVATGAREIATEFTGRLQGTQGFTGNADQSGRTLVDRVSGTDLGALANLSNAGHMMQPDGTGALLATQPQTIGGFRIPDSIAQPARELAALDTLYRVSQTASPQTAEQVNNAVFDYSTAVMVNTARRTEGALQDSEYSQASRGLDSGTYHSAIASTSFGELPARTAPPPGVPPRLLGRDDTAQGAGQPDIG